MPMLKDDNPGATEALLEKVPVENQPHINIAPCEGKTPSRHRADARELCFPKIIGGKKLDTTLTLV